jgi:hypothetical protein
MIGVALILTFFCVIAPMLMQLVTNCFETVGAGHLSGTVLLAVIGTARSVAPFQTGEKKGLLPSGEIGYILNLYIIQNCILSKYLYSIMVGRIPA